MSAVPRPTMRPFSLPRTELLGRLRRDDVEVAVKVDERPAFARAAANDARLLQAPGARGQLDQLGRESEVDHRVAERAAAAPERAPRRVLALDGDERLDQLRHLLGPRLEPRAHLIGIHGDALGHQLVTAFLRSYERTCGQLVTAG